MAGPGFLGVLPHRRSGGRARPRWSLAPPGHRRERRDRRRDRRVPRALSAQSDPGALVFFLIGVYSIPSLWFIGFYFIVDVLRQAGNCSGAARAGRGVHGAHRPGYLYGFAVAFVLLATRVVKREEFDVFYLFRQCERRAAVPGGRAALRSADSGESSLRGHRPPPERREAEQGAPGTAAGGSHRRASRRASGRTDRPARSREPPRASTAKLLETATGRPSSPRTTSSTSPTSSADEHDRRARGPRVRASAQCVPAVPQDRGGAAHPGSLYARQLGGRTGRGSSSRPCATGCFARDPDRAGRSIACGAGHVSTPAPAPHADQDLRDHLARGRSRRRRGRRGRDRPRARARLAAPRDDQRAAAILAAGRPVRRSRSASTPESSDPRMPSRRIASCTPLRTCRCTATRTRTMLAAWGRR